MAKKVKIVSPAAGKVLALSATNDEVFSTGMMGEGFGLEPVSEQVVAPVSGRITMVADSKHAVGITTKRRFRSFGTYGYRYCRLERRTF